MSTAQNSGDGGSNTQLSIKPLGARLYSLTLESPEPKALAGFYTRTMGFAFAEEKDRMVGCALDRRLIFVRGVARKLAAACFAVNEASDLDSLEQRLRAAGIAYSRVPHVSFRDSVSFTDTDGNTLIFAHGQATEKLVPSEALANRTARLQHVVLGSLHAERLIRFYCDVVGFRVSDTVLDEAGLMKTAFLNCSHEHHSIAIFATSQNRLDHFCFEAGDWGLIRDWSDHFAAERIPLKWGPGRHGPGNNLFVFIHDLDGNWVEVSAELEQLAPDRPPGTWRHEERTLNSWGEGRLRS